MESPELVDALLAGKLDTGVARPPVDHGLQTRTVWTEPLMVAVPVGHRLATAPAIPVQQLTDEPIVLFPRSSGPGYWDQVQAVLRIAGIS